MPIIPKMTLPEEPEELVENPSIDIEDDTELPMLLPGSSDTNNLSNNFRQTQDYAPDDAAFDYDTAKQTSIDEAYIKRNRAFFEAEDGTDRMLLTTVNAPGVRSFLQKPTNMAASKDDIKAMADLERAFYGENVFRRSAHALEIGSSQVELGSIRYQQIYGNTDIALEKRANKLKSTMSTRGTRDGWLETGWYGMLEMLPQVGNTIEAGLDKGLKLGLLAGGMVAAIGQLGPQALTPEEVFTVPVAAVAGLKAGFIVGSSEAAIAMETGLAFDEFLDFRDENNKPLDLDVARVAAIMAGMASGGIEVVQTVLGLKAAGAGEFTKGFTREAIRKALQTKATREILFKAVRTYGKTVVLETAMEVVQESIVMRTGEIAKVVDEGDFKALTAEEAEKRLRATAFDSAAAFSLMMLPGGSVRMVQDRRAAKRSLTEQETLNTIDSLVSQVELRDRSGDLFEEAMDDITATSEIDTVYIPATVVDQKIKDPEELKVFLEQTETTKQYEEALITGTDLEVPIQKYGRYLAGTDLGKLFEKDRKITPDGMTVNEVADFEKTFMDKAAILIEEGKTQEKLKTKIETEAADISTQIQESLLNAGVSKKEAKSNALLWDAFLTTYSERGFIESPKAFPVPDIKRGIDPKRRGRFTTYETPGKTPLIQLFETADESTFLHETSHSWVSFIRDAAIAENATEGMKAEWETIKKAFDFPENNEIPTELNEKFAEAFEQYFLEGKAPSIKLRGAFERFSAWLRGLYKRISQDDTIQIPDSQRAMFDRMLATDEDMDIVEEYHNAKQPFIDLIGIENKKAQEAYHKKIDEAKATSREKRYKKYRKAYIKALGGKKKIREFAVTEVEKDPAYLVMKEVPQKGGIDLELIESIIGKDNRIKLGKRQPGLLKKNGLDPNVVALDYEFESVNEMSHRITDAKPKKEAVDDMTEYILKAEEDRIMNALRDQDAIVGEMEYHGDERISVLIAEHELVRQKISRKKAVSAAKITRAKTKAIKDAAKEVISNKPINKAIKYSTFSNAELKASQNAKKAIEKKNFEATAKFKMQEILNHALVIESVKARENLPKILKRIKTAAKTDPKRIAEGYLNQIKFLTTKYKLSTKGADPDTKSLDEFTNDLKGGVDLDSPFLRSIPDWPSWMSDSTKDVVDGKRFAEQLTYGELLELNDAITWLKREGIDQRTGQLESYDNKNIKEVLSPIITNLESIPKKRVFKENSTLRKMSDRLRKFSATHDLLPFILDAIDGFTNYGKNPVEGPARLGVGGKLEQAQDVRSLLEEDIDEQITPHINQFLETTELNYGNVNEAVAVPEVMRKAGQSWTYDKIIAVALNMGNQTNIERVMAGYDMELSELHALVRVLSEKDLMAVQGIWDTFNSMWPKINEENFKAYNFHKKGVKAQPIIITTKDGTAVELKGGYYPLKYDRKLLKLAGEKWEPKDDILQNNIFGHPKVKDGFLQDRKESKNISLPVMLDPAVLVTALDEGANFISHAVVIRDIDRITRNSEFTKAVVERLGSETYDVIRPTLRAVAKQYQPLSAGSQFADSMKSYATAYILAVNPSVALKQPFSLFGAINDMGLYSLARGLEKTASNPLKAFQSMNEMSVAMRTRNILIDNKINAKVREMSNSPFSRRLAGAARIRDAVTWAAIKFFDTMTVTPIWWGAYLKELNLNDGNQQLAVEFADRKIRQSQPGGTALDVPLFQKYDNGYLRFFGMFMSFTIKFGNRQRASFRAFEKGQISAKEYFNFVMIDAIAPPLLMSAMFMLLQGKDPDEEEVLVDVLSYQFSGYVFLRSFAGSVASQYKNVVMGSKTFEQSMSDVPALEGVDLFQNTVGSLMQLIADLDDDKKQDKAVWAFAEMVSFKTKIPATKLYRRLSEGMRQFEEERDATIFNVILPDPAKRKRGR